MDGSTRCPHCDTRFRIAAAQLQAHQGQVRCGHCLQAFDARQEFISDEPHPQLELASLFEPAQVADEAAPPHPNNSLDFSQTAAPYQANPTPPDEISMTEKVSTDDLAQPARGWGVLLAIVLLAVLAFQFSYHYRADLAARVPASKPALQGLCQLLKCTLNLPQNSELISIESSNLEADSSNNQLVILSVLLRNHANYALALPNLELTLNDAQERPLARRIFLPNDYLLAGQKNSDGLPANQELGVQLWLQLDDINPNGYRLVLLYPNT